MERATTSRWRTFEHARTSESCYACCQIIDQRTKVLHLIPLEPHQYHSARITSAAVDSKELHMALWPTASVKQRQQLPMLITKYLYQVRGNEFPAPSKERKVISLTVYPDGTLSWPVITQPMSERTASRY